MIGLNRAALIVARYKAVRKRALPSRPNWARPRTLVPDSRGNGVKPA